MVKFSLDLLRFTLNLISRIYVGIKTGRFHKQPSTKEKSELRSKSCRKFDYVRMRVQLETILCRRKKKTFELIIGQHDSKLQKGNNWALKETETSSFSNTIFHFFTTSLKQYTWKDSSETIKLMMTHTFRLSWIFFLIFFFHKRNGTKLFMYRLMMMNISKWRLFRKHKWKITHSFLFHFNLIIIRFSFHARKEGNWETSGHEHEKVQANYKLLFPSSGGNAVGLAKLSLQIRFFTSLIITN